MKHLILALVFTCVTSFTFGQNKGNFQSNNVNVINDEYFSHPYKSVIDTLYPSSNSLACAQTSGQLVILTINSSEWIFGCNSYFDTEAAQIYDIGTNSMEITKVICWIQKMGTAGTMYAKIYDVETTTNKPTTLLSTSDAFLNSSLPVNPAIAQKAVVNFSQPITVSGKFAVSIQFFCALPQGSAMGLASSANGCTVSNDKNSCLKDANGVWYSSQEYVSGGTPLLTDVFILPVGNYSTRIQENIDKNSFNCFPNPANDMIKFFINSTQVNSTIEIYNSIGKLMDVIICKENETNINLKKYSSGPYYYQLKSNTGGFVGKGKFIKI
jgi:hypothetical protein